MTTPRNLAFLSMLVASTFLHATEATNVPQRPVNVILIGWDGVGREEVGVMLEGGELPNLKQLISEGRLVDIDVRGSTEAKPGWAQILTGYDPDVTGVHSNTKYQPIPKGSTVFERLKNFFEADKFVAMAVIGTRDHVGESDPPRRILIQNRINKADRKQPDPPGEMPGKDDPRGRMALPQNERRAPGTIMEEDGATYRVVPGSPYYFTRDGVDAWECGLGRDRSVVQRAAGLIEKLKNRPFFMFVHIGETGQKRRPSAKVSRQYAADLIDADAGTGLIVAKLKDLNLYERTKIYVTSDHGSGQGPESQRGEVQVFLATNDPLVIRNGDRADITPTILDRFGVDLKKISPRPAGHSLLRPKEGPTQSTSTVK